MKLSDYGEALAYDVAFQMLGMDDPNYPVERLGKLSLELSAKLRSLAIITLLVKAETDNFFHNLIRSGCMRETYLRRAVAAGLLQDHHRCLGRFEPVLDLIAAGAFEDVQRIRELSPGEFRAGHEYEDDHWYAASLHELSKPSPDEYCLMLALDSFEKALDGMSAVRLNVLRALVVRDQGLFVGSFQTLLAQRTVQLAADKERGLLEEPALMAECQVYIEGLAMLRLAGRSGLTTDEEYLYCPSSARVPIRVPYPY
jgi:hypothetical protein